MFTFAGIMEAQQDKRKKNSRPLLSEDEKKVPITIYKKKSEIALLGGMEKIRGRLSDYFDDDVYDEKKSKT